MSYFLKVFMLWKHLLLFLFPSLTSFTHLYSLAMLGSSVPQKTSAVVFRDQAPPALIFAVSALSSCISDIACLLKNNCTCFTANNIYFIIYLVIQNFHSDPITWFLPSWIFSDSFPSVLPWDQWKICILFSTPNFKRKFIRRLKKIKS